MRSIIVTTILIGLLAGKLPAADLVRETLDVAYGDDAQQKLDVYLPTTSSGRRPAVVWVHGGGWTEGDKRKGPNSISVLSNLLVGAAS